MQTKPAYAVAAGTFVALELDGRRSLCLKVERVGKEHINHFVVPLEPLDDRRQACLVYVDPELPLTPVEGVSFAFEDGAEETAPDVGDIFLNPFGAVMKVLDGPKSQRLHAYVDVTTGQARARMERHIRRLLEWRLQRV
ncbi:hypothetical protein [Magnetospirillum sp. UT-4]|uniref:hypothetical protein n=1 Tax=Magnetospirillum sp. UT-4 TaxID=2681467 RepID=UPI00137F6FD4|nr:hypothetical protein [Magnetospirillum sp. UT-4]CAA7616449.1 conserved hypothetical protein [Magnetospirillum sp. UT-4]